MVEVTMREAVLMKPIRKAVLSEYGEIFEGAVNVYPLEEIIAEKIRAILQFAKKVHERGWARSRVRDY
jgi:predicted nucleotidyltransferase component of viral defense system